MCGEAGGQGAAVRMRTGMGIEWWGVDRLMIGEPRRLALPVGALARASDYIQVSSLVGRVRVGAIG